MGIVCGFSVRYTYIFKISLENVKRGEKIRPLNCKIPVDVFAVEPGKTE